MQGMISVAEQSQHAPAVAPEQEQGPIPMDTTTTIPLSSIVGIGSSSLSSGLRDSLTGIWILDKSNRRAEDWKTNKYLETMNVDPLAIEAHEKGELEQDTVHTITMYPDRVEIVKQSRVNNLVRVSLTFGEEFVEYLPPGNRPKKSLALSPHPAYLEIQSSLHTVNGIALVTDKKRLLHEPALAIASEQPHTTNEQRTVLVQELTITNQATGKACTTIRYFLPYSNDVTDTTINTVQPMDTTSGLA